MNTTGNPIFFAHSADSVNSMLKAAMDTLRKDDSIYPFVSNFIAQRGLPVWNKASGSYREGHPVFTVPVRDAQERRITGIVTIVVKDDNPHYNWTPRGVKVDGKVSEGVEVMMWVYEKGSLVNLIRMMGDALKPSRPRPLRQEI